MQAKIYPMADTNTAPIILIDGSSYLYRAFHALPELVNSKGLPTGAAKGVINMIRRLIKDYPGSTVAVIFDAKGKTFRDDIYPEYKANRPSMPDELRSQIEPIHKMITAMGLPLVVVPGVEADDVIGTYCQQATEQQVSVIVSTGDKDLAQLVNKYVTLINTMTNVVMDPAGVVEKFGVGPELIIDMLALMGDKVDNIPGVPGVGEKTALGLLQSLGGIDAIYANLDAVADVPVRGAKKLGDKLAAEKANAYLSYQLATIKLDVELDAGIEELKQAEQDDDALQAIFAEMEFKSWQKKGGTDKGSADDKAVGANVAGDYELVLTSEAFTSWLIKLAQAEQFAFDAETTSVEYMAAKVVGVSFAVEAGSAAYVPFAHDYIDAPEQLSEEFVLGQLKPLLEDAGKAKIGQNLKYDAHVLKNHGIAMRGMKYDTMLESYVNNSTASRHNMDSLAQHYLDLKTVSFEEVAGKGAKQLTFNQVSLDVAAPYAAEDADITLRLHEEIYSQLKRESKLLKVFNELEMPLLPVLAKVEQNGALLDVALLQQHSIELGKRLEELEKQAYELADQPFNLASPKQLGEILFEKLKLPVLKKTKKGAPSTAEEVLQELALDYPLPKVLMEYRGLAKLKSTYTDTLPLMVDGSNRVHTSYQQAVTATGRLSSTNPNLQNIPIRNAEGRRIRQAFIPPQGYTMVAADYSQIELRIMAHLSGDQGLRNAFAQGLDIHRATAAEVFDVSLEAVSIEQRRSAKAINFGLIYGMSAFGLAKQLDVGRHQAQEYMDLYFDRYPGVAHFMDDIKVQAKDKGYVETLRGRRLYLPNINASNGMLRQGAERTAINAPMQGTAADIIKQAMIDVDKWLEADNIDARMIMQVHDELVFEVATPIVEGFIQTAAEIMEAAAELAVPLVVDVGQGTNWDEAH
jgi:DNA polymerase-1|tara:strand:+ start:41187 stop:43934 length:2748 start_codon:yes stop_codon:yes gene_type:complete